MKMYQFAVGEGLAKMSVKTFKTLWSKDCTKVVLEGMTGPQDHTLPAVWPGVHLSICHVGSML